MVQLTLKGKFRQVLNTCLTSVRGLFAFLVLKYGVGRYIFLVLTSFYARYKFYHLKV